MTNKKIELSAFLSLFVGISVVTFFVFRPFLGIIALATILAVLFYPWYKKLTNYFHGGESFFAGLLVVVALIFLIIPLLFFGAQILGQAQNFFASTQAGQGDIIQIIQQKINSLVGLVIPNFSFNMADLTNKILVFVSSNLGEVVSQTAYIFFETFFLLFTFFFFLRDGDKILRSIISLSPFEKKQNKEIIDSVHQTITAVIRGTLLVGLIRFFLLTITFYLFGIPNPLLWASIGGIIGAVPGLGTPFVIIPTIIYLLLNAQILPAIGVGIIGVLLVLFIDNILSTYFYGKGFDVQPIFVLFSILGGIIFFGPLGFIFGPIILSLFISGIDMYKILILDKKAR